MSIVFPVAVLSAEFWITWSLFVFVADTIGDQIVEAYSIMGLVIVLYVASKHSFCLPQDVFLSYSLLSGYYKVLGSQSDKSLLFSLPSWFLCSHISCIYLMITNFSLIQGFLHFFNIQEKLTCLSSRIH